jgi:serine/threonine-protein kinase
MTTAIGKLIGPYRLDMPLASGALGHTLRAQHLSSGEIVAIKLFHTTLSADPNFADRFRPIMQAASDVKHPNVLPIREFGEQGGQYFVVMDFISTGSLRTLFQRELGSRCVARSTWRVRRPTESPRHTRGARCIAI